jgi:hypothetical protein
VSNAVAKFGDRGGGTCCNTGRRKTELLVCVRLSQQSFDESEGYAARVPQRPHLHER